MSGSGWIGVDLDGTLAEYDGWKGPSHIGKPIEPMVARVKEWLKEGKDVRIFTARVFPLGLIDKHEVITPKFAITVFHEHGLQTHRVLTAYESVLAIRSWCAEHLNRILPITCIKDFSMYQLWDDRAVQVETNTGLAYVHPFNAGKAMEAP